MVQVMVVVETFPFFTDHQFLFIFEAMINDLQKSLLNIRQLVRDGERESGHGEMGR